MSSSNTSPGQDAAGQGVWPNTGSSQSPLDEMTASNVNLNEVLANGMTRDVICFLNGGGNEYDGHIGVRVSALFVILVVSTAVTFFPVVATRSKRLRIPLYFYLFARYFGAGVIIATAFIHLLDPAYEEIGPASCVGMTGGWSQYSFVAGIALSSGMIVFLLDFAAERYVEKKYDMPHGHAEANFVQDHRGSIDDAALARYNSMGRRASTHQHLHSGDQDRQMGIASASRSNDPKSLENGNDTDVSPPPSYDEKAEAYTSESFKKQISGFLILEFGVIFHSVIIGLTLATSGWDEFKVLYVVIVFHQSFEGLGVGARLSAIPFPKRLHWMPWALCAAYGLTTPIAIAIGLGVRTTYNSGSYTANVVSGVLDATSAGILIYTGFVEFLARDFLFNPERTKDDKQLAFMVVCTVLGAGIMALLGKWA